jgi:recombination protein RecA
MNFDDLKKNIEKNVKGVHCSVLSESDIATNRFWLKTPALDLNRILSGSFKKGIQSRNLVGICGPEHTMKSSFMVLCMAEAQKQGKKCVIIDTEGGISADFCKRWGLDPNNILYTYTPWIHEVKSILAQIRESGETDYVIGLDSVGGIDRYKSVEDALKGDPKQDQGLLQKDIRGTLKLFLNICVGQNSIGIVTGHMYGMPSSVPMPDQVGGGKAMKLFPSVLISLKKKNLMEGKDVVGNEIIATTIKNRLYPPFQTATVHLDYANGIQPYAGLIDLGVEAGKINQKGSWFSYGDTKLGQGAIKAAEALKDLPQVLDELDAWLATTGYSTVNEEVEKAVEILEKEETVKK